MAAKNKPTAPQTAPQTATGAPPPLTLTLGALPVSAPAAAPAAPQTAAPAAPAAPDAPPVAPTVPAVMGWRFSGNAGDGATYGPVPAAPPAAMPGQGYVWCRETWQPVAMSSKGPDGRSLAKIVRTLTGATGSPRGRFAVSGAASALVNLGGLTARPAAVVQETTSPEDVATVANALVPAYNAYAALTAAGADVRGGFGPGGQTAAALRTLAADPSAAPVADSLVALADALDTLPWGTSLLRLACDAFTAALDVDGRGITIPRLKASDTSERNMVIVFS